MSRLVTPNIAEAAALLDTRPASTLSSALAALRPQRDSWFEAALDAKSWLSAALAAGDELEIGRGHGPVHHFHAIWDR